MLAGRREVGQYVAALVERGHRAPQEEDVSQRARPDEELRQWALAQTARAQDEPLWQRLAEIGVDTAVTR